MSELNPYTLSSLLTGTVRAIRAPYATTLAAKWNDIFNNEKPYAVKTGYLDIGAATESTTYERGLDSDEIEIEQETGAVFEEITETSRTIELSMAEFTADHLKMLEEGEPIVTIAASAAAATTGNRWTAAKAVDFGPITDLTPNRLALVGRRKPIAGATVTESNGTTKRGQFVGVLFFNATLAAEDAEIEWEKGSAAHMPVTMRAFPDPANNGRVGRWILEDGTAILA